MTAFEEHLATVDRTAYNNWRSASGNQLTNHRISLLERRNRSRISDDRVEPGVAVNTRVALRGRIQTAEFANLKLNKGESTRNPTLRDLHVNEHGFTFHVVQFRCVSHNALEYIMIHLLC